MTALMSETDSQLACLLELLDSQSPLTSKSEMQNKISAKLEITFH